MKIQFTEKFLVFFLLLLLFCFPANSFSQSSGSETCDNGLLRCNNLRNNVVLYWACMEETCETKKDENPNCTKGQGKCVPQLSEYRLCINIICKNPKDSFNECEEGKTACVAPLRKYWGCVNETCLGGVEKFLELEKAQPEEPQEENEVIEQREQFVPLQDTTSVPEERLLKGPPSTKIFCKNTDVSIYCRSADIDSCTCGDGSAPEEK